MSTAACPNCARKLRDVASKKRNNPNGRPSSFARKRPRLHTKTTPSVPIQTDESQATTSHSLGHAPCDTRSIAPPSSLSSTSNLQSDNFKPGHAYKRQHTVFEVEKAWRDALGLPPHAPFASEAEWELAEIVVESQLTQKDTDRLLRSRMYSHCRASAPCEYNTFKDKKSFNKMIDQLPGLAAGWKLIEITVKGNMVDARGQVMEEVLDCWVRDPVEVTRELIGNPEFKDCTYYAPIEEHVETVAQSLENSEGPADKERIFTDFANTEWWRRVSVEISKTHPGATIAPLVVASDKTQLSTFSGDKQAWPVYITLGNIDKDVRRKPSRRAVALLGYLPVTKLHCFRESDRALQGYRVFHFAMRQMLMPLMEAGKMGVWMTCADGNVRHVFPLLAAYIADHPEQCLVCCTKENRCPTCLVERDRRGELLTSCYRDPDAMLAALQQPRSDMFEEAGLRDIPEPFWAGLPYANIFNCIVPDLLHQLHKGVFMTHLVKWISKGNEDEIDARFQRVPPYPNLRLFTKGISGITQWTGNEFRQMEKVFICLIDGLHEDPRVMTAARAILDFIYLAHYPSHSVSTLEQMRDALKTEVTLASALHLLNHRLRFRASNRKDYVKQMITWLTRREKVRWFQGFLRWCRVQDSQSEGDDEEQRTTRWEREEELQGDDRDNGGEEVVEERIALTLGAHHSMAATPSHTPDHSRLTATTISADPEPPIKPHTSPLAFTHLSSSATKGLDGEGSDDTDDCPDWQENDPDAQDVSFGPYSIARKAGLGHLPGSVIAEQFGASDFGGALAAFLAQEGVVQGPPSVSTILSRSYPVYKKFSRILPSLRGLSDTMHDTVFAYPAINGKSARYSTILFVENPDIAENIGVQGYRVGQVRAIFGLPPDLQRLRPDLTDEYAHLAYVELYTPFTVPERYSKLYKVMRMYRNQKRLAIVVPLRRIFRSCHLFPVCGREIDRTWSSDDVLEQCDVLYLNPFSDHHMYLFV